MGFDAVMILGKELRRDRVRGLRELKARCAGASVAMRRGAETVVNLEAPLRGQEEAGSLIVQRYLRTLGVRDDQMVLDQLTRSTREEAMLGAELADEHGWRRLLVVTSSYHVERARRHFEGALNRSRVAIFAPESFLRHATDQERAWILDGTPDARALEEEARVERVMSVLETVLRPLPSPLRWRIEVCAGGIYRGVTSG